MRISVWSSDVCSSDLSAGDLTALRRKLAAGGIQPGSTQVHLKLDDGSEYSFPGSVQFSEVTVDERTGTVTLMARFRNPDGILLTGMFVSAMFDQANDTDALLVPRPPSSAISTEAPT